MPGDAEWLILLGKIAGFLTFLGTLAATCKKFNITPRRVVRWLAAVWAYETLLAMMADKDQTIKTQEETIDRRDTEIDRLNRELSQCLSQRGSAASAAESRSGSSQPLDGPIPSLPSTGSTSGIPS